MPTKKTSTPPCLSVVVPCYNEEATVEILLRKVLSSPVVAEVIAVDDGSRDLTRDIIVRLQEEVGSERLRLLCQDRNRGKGAALRLGFAAATAPYVVVQDADLEYDPSEYPQLLQPLLDGDADVVYGSRFISDRPHRVLYFWHSMGNKVLTVLSNMTTNLNLTDMETCYKVFRREVIQNIDIEENRFGFEPEVTAKIAAAGLRVYEVGVSYRGRTYAEGKKIGWKDGFRAIYCIARYSPKSTSSLNTSPVNADHSALDLNRALEVLVDATNYNSWVADLTAPHLTGRIAEVGAGVGTMTELYPEHLDEVIAVEPDAELCQQLKTRIGTRPNVEVIHGDLSSIADRTELDGVVLVNVLEHIDDDEAALRQISSMLKPDGRVVLFVPAGPRLYSDFDAAVGHHRRYELRKLAKVLRRAGFQIDTIHHVNSIGAVLWWIGMKHLHLFPSNSKATRVYDRLIVPMLRRIERIGAPPFGQSILAVATRRPDTAL